VLPLAITATISVILFFMPWIFSAFAALMVNGL
jgi:hypothetical protein